MTFRLNFPAGPARRVRRFGALVGMAFLAFAVGCLLPSESGPVLTTVTVTLASNLAEEGSSTTATAAGLDQHGASIAIGAVTWSSESPSVATVDAAGVVHAIAVGQAFIVATVGGKQGRALFGVTPRVVATVDVTPAVDTVAIDSTRQLTATPRDTAGAPLTGHIIVWRTYDDRVATVNANGLVTGVTGGSTTIAASTEGKQGLATIVVPTPDIFITIESPAAGGLVGDSPTVIASVTSVYQIASVSLTIGSTTVPMTLGSSGGKFPHPAWVGTADLSSEPFGTLPLGVTVTDTRDSSNTRARSVVHDPPPTILVSSPIDATVASPDVTLQVTCTDRNAAACATLVASVSATSTINGTTIASGTTSLTGSFSLAQFEGSRVILRLAASDSAGQGTAVLRSLWVESSPHLQPIASVPGVVADYAGGDVLYADTSGSDRDVLKLHHNGGGDETMFDEAWKRVNFNYSFLTSTGAVYEKDTDYHLATGADVLQEFSGGVATTFDSGYVSHLAVRGDYALWLPYPTSSINLRNVSTGQNTVVATDATGQYDVTVSGDVAYITSDSLHHVAFVANGGTPVPLTSPVSGFFTVDPRTDGTRVVFSRLSTNYLNRTYQIFAVTTAGVETALSTPTSVGQYVDRDYQVNSGWIAFTRQSATGEMQVWTNDPAGTSRQVSQFGATSLIEALGPDGEVVFKSGTMRYLSTFPYTSYTAIGAANGTVRWRDGQFVVLLGRSVFAVQ